MAVARIRGATMEIHGREAEIVSTTLEPRTTVYLVRERGRLQDCPPGYYEAPPKELQKDYFYPSELVRMLIRALAFGLKILGRCFLPEDPASGKFPIIVVENRVYRFVRIEEGELKPIDLRKVMDDPETLREQYGGFGH